jgi:hypothetical protein
MRLLFLLFILFNQGVLFAQKLKISTVSISAGKSYIRDPYSSFDYYKGYARNPSDLNADSIKAVQFSELVPNSTHQTVWYNNKMLSLKVGFKPQKDNREFVFGINYSTAQQSSFRGHASRSLAWDTLSITNGFGEIDTFYSTLRVDDDRIFELKTKNLQLSIEYLFKTKSTYLNYYVGLGLSFGTSIKNTMYSQGMPMLNEVLYNPSSGQHYTTSEVVSYPSWFYEQKQLQYSGDYYWSKQIYYFTPYLPFGMNIPLSQTVKGLSHFSIDIRGSLGLEVQMMKLNTTMIRQIISGNIGLKYTL